MTIPPPNARVWIEIDLNKIKANVETIIAKVSPLKLMAVLKADAYGLGALRIAEMLSTTNVYSFGVADAKEALAICHLGKPIQILGGLTDQEVPIVVEKGFIAPITDKRIATRLSEEAQRQNKTVDCHFLLDTGMGRLGILYDDSEQTIRDTIHLPGLNYTGLYSHFPQAYNDISFSVQQIEKLKYLLNNLNQNGIQFPLVHIANSDGINNVPASYRDPFTMVRSGINLYGEFDLEGDQSIKLASVITLKARLVAIRKLPVGQTIGYGKSYETTKPILVGTVSAGYADGVPLSLSNTGSFLINGKRCPIIGRISMDYTTVSIADIANAEVGDEVVCLGDKISVTNWAEARKTVSYDVICSIGNRVERNYVE